MKNQFNYTPRKTRRAIRRREEAFTMTELAVVIVALLLLALVVLPAVIRSNGQVLRAKCANNLRQLGVAVQLYASESNDYVPVCAWPNGQGPWQSYTVARILPGTGTLIRGYMGPGLLVRAGIISDPEIFYCPGLATSLLGGPWSYDYYTSGTGAWPSTPVDSGDLIRTSYNYYPQVQRTVLVAPGIPVAAQNYTSVRLEYGGILILMAPKWFELNPRKSLATDLVHGTQFRSHSAGNTIAGVNALFPDGKVAFQSARRNPANFDPVLWNNIGSDSLNFRRVMFDWNP
jgi:type II secretory pathway pseudopilin PulG